MRCRLILLIVLAALLWAPLGSTAAPHSAGRVFYVSADGSDGASGLSPDQAWRSVRRVDAARLQPGDRVLFRGEDTFSGTTLMPHDSGTAGQPIVFGVYGRGLPILQARRSAVFLAAGISHLTFTGLRLTTGAESPSSIFASAATGGGSTDIRITHCRFFATGGAAIVSKKAADTDWQITDDRISRTGDSGLILLGTGAQIRDNLIQDVGLSKTIPWGRHGIYMKAAHATIVDNVIRRFHDDGISLRFPDARVVGNTIDDGGIGIAYFSYDAVAGVSLVHGNKISRVRYAGFYYDPTARGGGSYPRESFELTDNVIQVSSGAGIDVQGATHASMRIYGNDVGGTYHVAIVANSPVGGSYYEENNTLAGVPLVRWNGQDEDAASYRSASGQGLSDVFAP